MNLPSLALAHADVTVDEAIRTFRQAIADAPDAQTVWALRRLIWGHEEDLLNLDAACRSRLRALPED